MTRRERMRARRRVERTMDEAFEALEEGNLALAARLSRRARDEGGVNPRILLDHARVMIHCRQWDEAEDSLRAAIAAAPHYGDAFATLARLQAERGKLAQAVRLMERAVELMPGDDLVLQALAAYREQLGPQGEGQGEAASADDPPPRTERTERYAWPDATEQVVTRGAVQLPALLAQEEAAALRDLYGEEHCEPETEWNDDEEGHYASRYLAGPLPETVQALRAELYHRAAAIANHQEVLLERQPRYPRSHTAYLRRAAGHRSSARLLRLPGGGSSVPHREQRRRAFPLQLLVDLGPGPGGEFVLEDKRPGRKRHAHGWQTVEGDGLLHAVQDRTVRVAGIYGLQPVLWSLHNRGAGTRLWLQLPFQDGD